MYNTLVWSQKFIGAAMLCALVVLTVGPLMAHAAATYSVAVSTQSISGTTLSLTGTGSAGDNYAGQLDQYDVSIDWGDTQNSLATDTFTDPPGNPKFFSGTWSASHPYAVGGTYTVVVKLCHSVCSGAESASADASVTIIVVIPSTQGGLVVQKVLVNDNGGSMATTSFAFQINGGTAIPFEADASNSFTVTAGAYTVTEVAAPGYTPSYSAGCTAGVVAGATTTCTITNDDVPAKLTVTKIVTNDNGGTKVVGDFTLLVGIQQVLSGVQNLFTANTYTVSEQGGAGYAAVIGGDCAANGSITLQIGDVKTCTITNDDIAPSLTLVKYVVGGAASATDWTLSASGPTPISGAGGATGDATFSAGTYDLSETGSPEYYLAGTWSCNMGQTDADTVVIGLDEDVTCSITNTYTPPVCDDGVDNDGDGFTDYPSDIGCSTLDDTDEGNENTLPLCSNDQDDDGDSDIDLEDADCAAFIPKVVVHKLVINDNFGTLDAGDFSFDVQSFFDVFFEVTGEGTGSKSVDLAPGAYEVTEDLVAGYTSESSGDCAGTIAIGETKYCSFENNDQETTLTVQKVLINDSGGTSATSTFSFTVSDSDPYIFDEDGAVVLSVMPGSYEVVEESAPGYTTSYSGQCEVTLGLGESATCVITNDDIPTDLCTNLDGVQTAIPEGMVENDGQCTIPEPVSTTACSNGVDDEDTEDSLADAADPACHTDLDPNNPNSYVPSATSETNVSGNGGGGGGGGGGNPNFATVGGGGGQVLGASTVVVPQVLGVSCGLSMDQYLRKGSVRNRPDQVVKLQELMNKHVGANLPGTGFFGPLTEEAVKAFQAKYAAAILAPWGISAPTGLVYITTLYNLNHLECPELTDQRPPLVPWSQNPNVPQ